MPSGPTSAMASAATVVPAPPGMFASSMPPELSNSASPIPSSEDRESVSSNDSRRRRASTIVNGVTSTTSANPLSSYSTPAQFVIDSDKMTSSSSFTKLRKKIKCNRSRANPNGGSYPVNRPLKVTIRRANAHSHTLASSQQGGRLSPSSVYSSVPGDDEKSPLLISGLSDGFRSASPNSMSTSKGVGFCSGKKDATTSTVDSSTITEPDLLGPCEPGSKIVLEGTVWLETPGAMVINAQWRGRAFVGTFLEASKNTLGPSCPDKMISSLSTVKCKPNWGGSASTFCGSYRNSTSGTIAASTFSGSIRTRSAIAAAEDPASVSRRRALPPGASSSRGRRRRRGVGMTTSSSTASLPAVGVDCNFYDQDDVATTSNALYDTPSISDFACPQSGCKKRFADIIGIRFHLDHCHAQRLKQEEPVSAELAITMKELRSSCSLDTQSLQHQQDTLQPPHLAELNSSEGRSFETVDEDPPPPKLDRGPTSDEAVEPSTIAMCEPPTASPAYSDISDDGPTAPQRSRTSVDIGQRPWPPPTVLNQPQTQPMDWSAPGRRVVPSGKPPYEYALTPQPPSNRLSLDNFSAATIVDSSSGGSPYAHQHPQSHHHHRPLNIPPTAHTSTDQLFQAHLANLISAGGNHSDSSGSPQLLPPSRHSPQVIPLGLHSFRPQ